MLYYIIVKNKRSGLVKKIAKVFSKVGNVLSSLIIKFFSLLVNSIIGLFKEIYRTFSYAAVGLFKTFDFIFTKLITVFSYLIYGIIFIFKWIGKITLWIGTFVYKYILRTIGIEIYSLGRAIGKGAFWSGKKIFYELPLFIINSFSDFFDYLSRKFKTTKERIVYFFKNTPKKIKTYFINKWNNLAIIKHYRNKKERELEVLLIDKFGKDAERSEKKQTFQYLARNGEGKLIKGYFSALSKLDTHSYLLDAGYEVYEIKTNWWINFTHNESTYLDRPMKNKDLIFWLAQLSTYIKSGIPLTDAVKILAEQDKRKKYKKKKTGKNTTATRQIGALRNALKHGNTHADGGVIAVGNAIVERLVPLVPRRRYSRFYLGVITVLFGHVTPCKRATNTPCSRRTACRRCTCCRRTRSSR